jgi:hypothetical protein
MSSSTETDDGRIEEQDTNADSVEEDSEAFNALLSDMEERLEKIDEEGEEIKELIGKLVVTGQVNAKVADDLHDMLVQTMAAQFNEHEEVTMKEVAMALWFELRRIIDSDDKNSEESPSEDAAAPSSDAGLEHAISDEDGTSDEETGQEAAHDPAFM